MRGGAPDRFPKGCRWTVTSLGMQREGSDASAAYLGETAPYADDETPGSDGTSPCTRSYVAGSAAAMSPRGSGSWGR